MPKMQAFQLVGVNRGKTNGNITLKTTWLLCPIYNSKSRVKLRYDTILKNFLLFCPKCKQEILIIVYQLSVSIIKKPDAIITVKKYFIKVGE